MSFTGVIGGVNRLGALGIGAGSLGFGVSGHSIETLAVELIMANRGFGLTAGASLTIGEAGPYSGIKTNSGNLGITVTSGNLTVAEAINTIGAAPPGNSGQGFQSGTVFLNAQNGNLTISDTITARGISDTSSPLTAISLNSSGITTVNAALTALAGHIFLSGAGSTVLGANLQTDGGTVSLANAVTLSAPTVTIDTDQTAGGNAGNVSISSQGIKSDVAGTRSLIIDARETGGDAGGSVSFFGGVGGAGRLAALGVGAGSVGFNNGSGFNSIGTLAIEVSNANSSFGLLTTGPLTIGSVGPFTGIKTNTGNVSITVESGTLTVAEAISTVGPALPTGVVGFVSLSTTNSTITVSNTITGTFVTLTANGTGTIAVNANIDARTGTLTLNAPNNGAVRLGADLQTDGAQISLVGLTTLTSGTVTLDTDTSLGGNAGSVTVTGTIDGNAANANTLVVDAHETGNGTGGVVNFTGLIGGAVRVGALGVLAGRILFASGSNNVGVIAVDVTNPNQSFTYVNADALTVGTVAPVSGITTNTGNVSVTVNGGAGTLTVEQAIDTDGAAGAGAGQTGAVALNATGSVTLTGPDGDVTAAGSFTVSADTDQNASGAYVQNAGATVSAASVQITASDVTIGDTITSAGNVTLLPSTTSATIGVAASGSFALSDAELDLIATPGTLTIGSTQNIGGITIATTGALSQDKNLSFVTGGTVTLGANNLQTSGTLNFTANRVNGGTGVVIAPTLDRHDRDRSDAQHQRRHAEPRQHGRRECRRDQCWRRRGVGQQHFRHVQRHDRRCTDHRRHDQRAERAPLRHQRELDQRGHGDTAARARDGGRHHADRGAERRNADRLVDGCDHARQSFQRDRHSRRVHGERADDRGWRGRPRHRRGGQCRHRRGVDHHDRRPAGQRRRGRQRRHVAGEQRHDPARRGGERPCGRRGATAPGRADGRRGGVGRCRRRLRGQHQRRLRAHDQRRHDVRRRHRCDHGARRADGERFGGPQWRHGHHHRRAGLQRHGRARRQHHAHWHGRRPSRRA